MGRGQGSQIPLAPDVARLLEARPWRQVEWGLDLPFRTPDGVVEGPFDGTTGGELPSVQGLAGGLSQWMEGKGLELRVDGGGKESVGSAEAVVEGDSLGRVPGAGDSDRSRTPAGSLSVDGIPASLNFGLGDGPKSTDLSHQFDIKVTPANTAAAVPLSGWAIVTMALLAVTIAVVLSQREKKRGRHKHRHRHHRHQHGQRRHRRDEA